MFNIGDIIVCKKGFRDFIVGNEYRLVAGTRGPAIEDEVGTFVTVGQSFLHECFEPKYPTVTGDSSSGRFSFTARNIMEIDYDKIQECLSLAKPFATLMIDGNAHVIVSEKLLDKTFYCRKGNKLRNRLAKLEAYCYAKPFPPENFKKLKGICRDIHDAPLKKKFKNTTVEVNVHEV